MLDLPAFKDFQSAANSVLDYLHRRVGFDLWMVTRVAGEEWVILQVEDHGYGVKPGDVFRWADTFCARMVASEGPTVSPRSAEVPAYVGAGIGKLVQIGAYIGVPLTREDGSLFGTLCAIHPAAQPDQIVLEQPLIELLARMLATILNSELKTLSGQRQSERLAAERLRDRETWLYDAAGWRALLAAEEARCRTYGHPAAVVALEVGPGAETSEPWADAASSPPNPPDPSTTRAVAEALREATRTDDVAARLGPGRFAMLLVECDRAGAVAVLSRITQRLIDEGVRASAGIGYRTVSGLEDDWRLAEQNMGRKERG